MGNCENCKEKILYNKYKRYRGKILCPKCYDTRLERKAAKKTELKRKAELVKIVTPSRKAKKAAKEQGIALDDTGDMIENEEEKTAEDSR